MNQWWEQVLDAALGLTKNFILDAKMGLNTEVNAADDLACVAKDSNATLVFCRSSQTHLHCCKFFQLADGLCAFLEPAVLTSPAPAKTEIIQCPCRLCLAAVKCRFKSCSDLRRHARRSSLSNGHNERNVLDFFIGALLSRVLSSC